MQLIDLIMRGARSGSRFLVRSVVSSELVLLELPGLVCCIMDEPELTEAAGALVIEKSSVYYCCMHHQSSSLSPSAFCVLQTKAPYICSSRGEKSNNLPCVMLLGFVSGATL